MPEELLELDPQTDDLQDDTTVDDTAQDEARPADEQVKSEDGKPEDQQAPVEVKSLFEPDGKKVAKPIREALQELKGKNQSLGKLVTDAVFRFAEFRREFPGGLTEARELRDKVEQFGGFADIESKLQGAEELSTLATQFTNGDPAFVDDMVASSAESFSALAPVVAERWREVNAEAWSAYIGRIVYADLQKNDVPLYLMRLADHVRDKPEAVEIINTINAYLGGFRELASKSPITKVTSKPAPANTNDQRENNLRAREWNIERNELQRSVRSEAYSKALDGRNPDTEEKAQIEELFSSRAMRLADQLFKDWRKTSQGYIQRNDKAGYLRYMGSIYKRVIPEAITSAVTSTIKGKAAVKKPAVNGASKTPIKAAEGFTVVAKEPDSYQVDYNRTTRPMLMENRAILKDGHKVTWR